MSNSIEMKIKGQTGFYKGKVRDVYYFGDLMAIVVSDRISSFDVILPEPIPFKGQILNQLASKMIEQTKDIVPNWVLEQPASNVTIGYKCEPYKVEMVIRGYLTGHAWREYNSGKRILCGVALPEGMKENDKFPEPIITPTTKANEGHDEDISKEEILKQSIVSKEEYEKLESYTRALFQRGTEVAAKRDLIMVDTKYEFGKKGNDIVLIDEIHTPDSSRYFYANTYHELLEKGERQKQLSKEFVREWLMENNFQGKEGQTIPEMTKEVTQDISDRYIELYEHVLGEEFVKDTKSVNLVEIIEEAIDRHNQ